MNTNSLRTSHGLETDAVSSLPLLFVTLFSVLPEYRESHVESDDWFRICCWGPQTHAYLPKGRREAQDYWTHPLETCHYPIRWTILSLH